MRHTFLACVAGVERRRGRGNLGVRGGKERNLSPSRAQIPPSPSPFNAGHAGCTFLYISLPFLHDYDVKLPEFQDCRQVKKCQIFIKVIMPFISDPLQKLNLSPPVKAHAFVTLGK